MQRILVGVTIAALSLAATGCGSSDPPPPQPGSPAFNWGSAKSAYQAGDFVKAGDLVAQITKSDNEFTARALPLSIVLSAGIAHGYSELADTFDLGVKANRANPQPFRRQASVLRGSATAAAIQCAESAHKLQAAPKTDTIPFDWPYPSGSANEPVALQRVAKGLLFSEGDVEGLQKAMMQRGVVKTVGAAVGAGDDPAKALEVFKAGDVKVARAAFFLAVAKSLQHQAELFGPKQLDQPNRLKILCDEAEELLKSIPETKETKEVLAAIAKMKKASRIT